MTSDKDMKAAIELAMEEGNNTVVSIVKYVRNLLGIGIREAIDYVCSILIDMGHRDIVKAYQDAHAETMRLVREQSVPHWMNH